MTPALLRLTLTHGASAALVMLRNLAAARLLGAEEFGIAAVFAILAGLAESLTGLGLQQLILRDRAVQSRKAMASLHLIQSLRGLIGGAVVFALAYPIARMLDLHDLVGLFYLMAIVPILTGFQHLDAFRAIRHGRYAPLATIQIGASLSSLAALLLADHIFSDHRAMLIALVTYASVATLLSHLVAQRNYRFELSQTTIRRTVEFGRPILFNGILLSVMFQAEKLVVGTTVGTAELGLFTLGLALTLGPALVLSKAQQSYFLPRLMRGERPDQSLTKIVACTALGLLLVTSLIAPLTSTLFGTDFAPLAPVLPLLGGLAALRLLRGGSVTYALARNQPKLAVIGNLPRIAVLPIFLLMLAQGASLFAALAVVAVAEAIGLALTLFLLKRPSRIRA